MAYGYDEGTPAPRQGRHRDVPDNASGAVSYRDSGYGTGNLYGAATQRGGGPSRGSPQYGADLEQPPWRFEDAGVAETTPGPPRRSRKPLAVAIIVGVLLILGGVGWFYLRDSPGRPSTGEDTRIADQKVDPIPLTAAEVFGSGAVPAAKGGGSYKVVKTQAATDCTTAAAGSIAAALSAAGCTQVVRATLMSPDNAFVITAGIFNLADGTNAGKASAATKTAVDAQQGRFSGLVAGGATNVVNRAAANVAWKVRGHYLMYCLIVKADGSRIAPSGSPSRVMTKDVVDRYLDSVVIHKRVTSGAPAVPSGRPS